MVVFWDILLEGAIAFEITLKGVFWKKSLANPDLDVELTWNIKMCEINFRKSVH